jgi:tetratricopeptide (TPR) repeat protein
MLLVGVWSSPAVADVLDRSWAEYRSTNFVVLSDQGEADVARAIGDLELFHNVVLKVTNARDGKHTIPVELYLFADAGDFQAASGMANVLGFMRPGLRTQYMAAGSGVIGLGAQHVIFHEYVHYLLRNGGSTTLNPKWYDEGLAEMLGATRLREDRVVLGGDIPERIRDLTQGILVPLSEVIRTNDLSAWHPYRVSVFYSKSFALVNYLHLSRLAGKGDRLPQLRQYLGLYDQGTESGAAFEQAFGMKIGAMERELGKFLTKSMRPVLELPTNLFASNPTYVRRELPPPEVAYRIGFLIVAPNPATARALFSHDGLEATNARYRAGVAISYQVEQNFERARGEMAAALAMGPDDPDVLQDAADLGVVWCRDDKAPTNCAELRDESRRQYDRLLEIQPDRVEAHAAFGALLNDVGDAAGAAKHLERVYDAAPWYVASIAELGIAKAQLGDSARAVPLLRRALAWIEGNSSLSARVRAALESTERQPN